MVMTAGVAREEDLEANKIAAKEIPDYDDYPDTTSGLKAENTTSTIGVRKKSQNRHGSAETKPNSNLSTNKFDHIFLHSSTKD